MRWQGWLGIALAALLAALPLLAAVLQPETPTARATRLQLYQSQQELDQAYRDLAAAEKRAHAAHPRLTIPTRAAEARYGNQHPR